MAVFSSMVRLKSMVCYVDANIRTLLPDARTRAAIHAPTSKDWVGITPTVFAPTNDSSE